jgi:hypothetical protein
MVVVLADVWELRVWQRATRPTLLTFTRQAEPTYITQHGVSRGCVLTAYVLACMYSGSPLDTSFNLSRPTAIGRKVERSYLTQKAD